MHATDEVASTTPPITEKPSEENVTQDDEAEDATYITGIALYAVLTGLTMAAFVLMLDTTIVVTAIPSITSAFNSLHDIGWYGSAYLLATCALQLPFGKIYQFHSSKFTFLSALVLFEVGSLICGVSTDSNMFIVGRAIAGCGGAGILNGGLTIIAAAAPLPKRPALLGILIGFSFIGLALGPLVGGALTQHASWRWCFYLNLPIGGVTFVALTIIRIPDAKVKVDSKPSTIEKVDRLDLPGCAIFAPAIIMLLLALEWGGVRYSWSSPTIIGLFCGAAGTFCVFLAWESRRGDRAMMPLGLFRNSIVSCAVVANIMSNGAFFLITYYLSVWFQVVKNASPLMSGVYTLPSVLSQIIGTIGTGLVVSKFGYYTPFIIVGGALSAVASGLMSTFTPTSAVAAWVCYQLLNGFSRGMILQQPITAVQANLPKDQLAIGSALVAFCQNFGAAVFVSLGQTIFANSLSPALAKFAPDADARRVVSVGATNFRTVVPEASVKGVVLAYNQALTAVFYLSLGACCATFAAAWGLGWTNLKAKEEAEKGDA